MLSEKTWGQFFKNLGMGSAIQAVLFLSLSVPTAPDLGQGSFASRSFVGGLLEANPQLFFHGASGVLATTFAIGVCFYLSVFRLPAWMKYSFPLLMAASLIAAMIIENPVLATEWLVYKRSATVQAFISHINLHRDKGVLTFLMTNLHWGFFLSFALANFYLCAANLLHQSRKFRHLKSRIEMSQVDEQSRIFSISGVITGLASLCFFLGVFLLSSAQIQEPGTASNRLARPNVFAIFIDGLRKQHLTKGSLENTWTPFLAELIEQAEFSSSMHLGSEEALPIWTEILSCQMGIHTGFRYFLPTAENLLNLPPTLPEIASASGYSSLLVSDFAGSFLTQVNTGFQQVSSPKLSLNSLATNSTIRSLSPLLAILLNSRLRAIFPSLLLSPAVSNPNELIKDFLSRLKQSNSLGSQPIFATLVFSQPYSSLKSDLSFLERNWLKGETQISVYKNEISRIDEALHQLFLRLKSNGWLENSVLVIAGLRGYEFQENTNPLTSVNSLVSPIILLSNGIGSESANLAQADRIVRTIDVAPTLARRMALNHFPFQKCDGAPLTESLERLPQFPTNNMYLESSSLAALGLIKQDDTDIIASQDKKNIDLESKQAETYLYLQKGQEGQLVMKAQTAEIINQIRDRGWINGAIRYSKILQRDGFLGIVNEQEPLFSKESKSSDLITQEETYARRKKINSELHLQLINFLKKNSVTWIPSPNKEDEDRGFFLEYINR